MRSKPVKSMTQTEQGKFSTSVLSSFLLEVANGDRFSRDAFAGGFCAGVVQDKSLKECVHMGQWLARLSLKELGPS